tara:strand:+ start:2240 stop:3043 length:804 start_codon:yes stop_codon:yes gene_type:complete
MDACIIIPARYASTRYPGKPLVPLKGASGQPRTLIERSILAARAASQGQIPIFVATDDERIAEEARRVGEDVIMTSPKCRNGTERVAEAISLGNISAEIVINLQGDAPLTPSHFVTLLIDAMRQDSECLVTTPCLRCDAETVRNLLADRQAGRVGATTVVFDRDQKALYFSKEVLPFTSGKGIVNDVVPVFHHVGVYAYRASALAAYAGLEPAPLENLEGLEQLRFLEYGLPIRMVEVSAPGTVFWELNNPSDASLIEGYLAKMNWD